MSNETTDENIVNIKRVCEEIVQVELKKESILILCILGYCFMFEYYADVIGFYFTVA